MTGRSKMVAGGLGAVILATGCAPQSHDEFEVLCGVVVPAEDAYAARAKAYEVRAYTLGVQSGYSRRCRELNGSYIHLEERDLCGAPLRVRCSAPPEICIPKEFARLPRYDCRPILAEGDLLGGRHCH